MSNSFETEQEKPEFENIANLAEDIVIRLPGCTDTMIRKTIQATYREFARQSCVFRTTRRCPVVGHECTIGPTLPDMYVDSVAEVRLGMRKLAPGYEYNVIGNSRIVLLGMPNFDMGEGDEGLKFLVDAADLKPEFKKFGIPHLHIICVEVPKSGSETAPSWFIEKFSEAIVSGTLYKLMSMSGKAWTDPAQAAVEKVTYDNFMNEARVNYVNGSQFGTSDAGRGVDTRVII